MSKLFSWIIGAFFLLSFTVDDKDKNAVTTLTIEFNDIRNANGVIHVFLYSYENQYPDNPYLHFEVTKNTLKSGQLLFSIPDLPPGKYAVSVIDDENYNKDLDLFLGIPTEGYGFSNNVKPFLSMPDYTDLLFDLNNSTNTLKLNLQYLI